MGYWVGGQFFRVRWQFYLLCYLDYFQFFFRLWEIQLKILVQRIQFRGIQFRFFFLVVRYWGLRFGVGFFLGFRVFLFLAGVGFQVLLSWGFIFGGYREVMLFWREQRKVLLEVFVFWFLGWVVRIGTFQGSWFYGFQFFLGFWGEYGMEEGVEIEGGGREVSS